MDIFYGILYGFFFEFFSVKTDKNGFLKQKHLMVFLQIILETCRSVQSTLHILPKVLLDVILLSQDFYIRFYLHFINQAGDWVPGGGFKGKREENWCEKITILMVQ